MRPLGTASSSNIPYPTTWPPKLSTDQLAVLLGEVRDHQLLHGSVIKRRSQSKSSSHSSSSVPALPTARPIGASLFPTAFPRSQFQQALDLQQVWNEVYAAAVSDEEWLEETLKPVIEEDELASLLWDVHLAAKAARAARGDLNDELEMGNWRSDYMLHEGAAEGSGLSLKQVEFNTISCAGGTHGNLIADMHAQLAQSGIYDIAAGSPISNELHNKMPSNTTIAGIASALRHAYEAYIDSSIHNLTGSTTNTDLDDTARPPSAPPHPFCILMLVDPSSVNIADEAPILSALSSPSSPSTSPITSFRVPFTSAILSSTQLLPSGILLYTPALAPAPTPSLQPIISLPKPQPQQQNGPRPLRYEVAVLYHRAGHAMQPRSETADGKKSTGWAFEARVRLERSRAVKCPSILGHLCTFKSVQVALTDPVVLARFLSDGDEANMKIKKVLDACMPMYTLDTPAGAAAARRILDGEEKGEDWVIKPVVGEGGGLNYFGKVVKTFLAGLMGDERRKEERAKWVLMRRMVPPKGVKNYLSLGSGQIWAGDVVSELGVFGGCLYRRRRKSMQDEGANFGGGGGVTRVEDVEGGCGETLSKPRKWVAMVRNEVLGFSLKSKMPSVDEMSVIKGYGVFDSPLLTDDHLFARNI